MCGNSKKSVDGVTLNPFRNRQKYNNKMSMCEAVSDLKF